MRSTRRVAVAVAIALASGLGLSASSPALEAARDGADWRTAVPARAPETAPARAADGVPWVGVNDLARLLGATKFWRPEVRKLVLRAGAHRIQLTVDNPFVIVDDAVVRLPREVRSQGGELLVPVPLVEVLPHDSTLARLVFDPRSSLVLQVPSSGVVGAPKLSADARETRLSFRADRPEEVVIASRSRAHFRIHMSGFFLGTLPDSIASASLVRSIRFIPSALGSAFELRVGPEALGYRVIQDVAGQRAVIVISRERHADLEPFAPEGPPGPRPVRVVVIDPGHGGNDPGVTVEGLTEKNLTLALAKLLKSELERRLRAKVVLTRDDDRDLPVDQRAERANRAHADLFLALHFDGFPGAHGVTAYCPPATFGSSSEATPGADRAELRVLPWRDVATRHAVRSRELAESVLSTLELRAQGPTRLREILPLCLLGVNAPGLMLECGVLTSPADRARVTRPDGLGELAASIASGVEAYGRSE